MAESGPTQPPVSELGAAERDFVWRANDISWLHYKYQEGVGWLTGTNPDPDQPMWGGRAFAPDGVVRRSAGFTAVTKHESAPRP